MCCSCLFFGVSAPSGGDGVFTAELLRVLHTASPAGDLDLTGMLGSYGTGSSFCWDGLPSPPQVMATHKAFVVGIDRYSHVGELVCCSKDASDVGTALRDKGFIVSPPSCESGAILPRGSFVREFNHFCRGLRGARTVVVYFAGHGVAAHNQYLLASDSGKFRAV
jgi:uncharacterized caspase-like protein